MRYGLYLADLRPARSDSRGTVNYAVGLTSALPPLLRSDEALFVLGNPEVLEELPASAAMERVIVDSVRAPKSAASRLFLDHAGVLGWARRRRLDVVHFPKGHLPFWRPQRPATVATIHDDIPVRYARKQFGAAARSIKHLYFAHTICQALDAADMVLTVSQFSADRLQGLRPIAGGKLVVTYEAPALPAAAFVPLAAREPTILILGSRFPHKRTAEAVAWGRRFTASPAGAGLHLTVIGELEAQAEQQCVGAAVRRVRGPLLSAELAQLIARSRVLVFHSLYEGFGLPPVEAYSLGTPAVYPRVSAMAEVMDGYPGGYAEAGYQAFARQLSTVTSLTDEELLELQSRMQRRYRWTEVARLTLDAYRSVAKR